MKPINGLYLDSSPADQPEGTVRHARNAVTNHLHGSLSNEPGFDVMANVGKRVLGSVALNNDESILFLLNSESPTNIGSEIRWISPDGQTKTILASDALSFQTRYPIQGTFHQNHKGERIVVWVDHVNPIRVLNIDDPGLPLTNGGLSDPAYLDLLNIKANHQPPIISSIRSLSTGGQLKSGTYYLAFAYELPDGSTTNWSYFSGPVMITDSTPSQNVDQYDGAASSTPTPKSISVSLTNLDSRFPYLRVGIVRQLGGVVDSVYAIRREVKPTMQLTYTGAEEEDVELIESILTNQIGYLSARTITRFDDRIYLANLRSREVPDIQPFVNAIDVKWTTKLIDLSEVEGSFKDEQTIYFSRGFFPDETYALYLDLVYPDGTFSPAFHIPGRAAGTTLMSYEDINGDPVSTNFADDADLQTAITNAPNQHHLFTQALKVDPQAKFFQFHETAKVDGTMGFWENQEETYPDTDDWDIKDQNGVVTATLRNQKVRHHKMPSLELLRRGTDLVYDPVNHLYDDTLVLEGSTSVVAGAVPGATTNLLGSSSSVLQGTPSTYLTFDGVTKLLTAVQDCTITIYGSDTFWGKATGSYPPDPDIDVNASVTATMQITHISGGVPTTVYVDTNSDSVDANPAEAQAGANIQTTTITLLAGDTLSIEYLLDLDTSSATVTQYDYTLIYNLYIGVGDTLVDQPGPGKFMPSIGLNLSNIHLPASVQSQIVGYRILYAKRTTDNQRIVGQSLLFHNIERHPFAESVTGELGSSAGNLRIDHVTNNASPRLDDATMRFHAFDLLYHQPAVAPSHLKTELKLRGIYQDVFRVTDHADTEADTTTNLQAGFTVDLINQPISSTKGGDLSENDRVLPLHDFRYIPADVSVYVSNNKINNEYGETFAYASIDHLDPQSDSNTTSGFADARYFDHNNGGLGIIGASDPATYLLSSLYLHRANQYQTFQAQELVTTPYLFDPASSDANNVFGGDTYVNRYGIRLSAAIGKPDLSGGTLYQSLNRYQALKTVYFYPCYSVSNIDLRHEDEQLGKTYFPKCGRSGEAYNSWRKEAADIANTNLMAYNTDYSAVQDKKVSDPETTGYLSRFPFRVIRSIARSPEAKDEPYRSFLPLDYYEMTKERGEIINLASLPTSLLIHCQRSLFRTRGQDVLQTGATEVTLGTGDIFSSHPIEVFDGNKHGLAGTHHQLSCVESPLGYFFWDVEQGKVFLLGEGLQQISSLGMRNFFRNEWRSEQFHQLHSMGYNPVYNDFPMLDGNAGYLASYDERYNRIIFTKRDYRLKDGVAFLVDPTDISQIPKGTLVLKDGQFMIIDAGRDSFGNGTINYATRWYRSLRNEEVPLIFDDYSQTITFTTDAAASGKWVSYHDYLPDFMWNTRNRVFSTQKEQVFRHNSEINFGVFYDLTIHPFVVDLVFNHEPYLQKVFSALRWHSEEIRDDNTSLYHNTFSDLVAYNSYQCSGIVPLTQLVTERNNEGVWTTNQFRDVVVDRNLPFIDFDQELIFSNINQGKPWFEQKRFIGNYLIARLSLDNQRQNLLHLYRAWVNTRPSRR